MTPRGPLICCIGAASLMFGTFCLAQKSAAQTELRSCGAYSGLPSDDTDTAGMVFIRGGTFVMGSERHRPEERFTHVVRVDGFWIDRHEVINAQFREFVAATGYVTLAERGLDPATHPGMPKELLAPGSVVFVPPTNVASGGRITQWWQYILGSERFESTGRRDTIAACMNAQIRLAPELSGRCGGRTISKSLYEYAPQLDLGCQPVIRRSSRRSRRTPPENL